MFKLPPLAHVAAGIPAAFPKPFNVVPPDKNTEPSVKIADVTGAVAHSSVEALTGAGFPPDNKAAELDPVAVPPPRPVAYSATSVQDAPSQ